MCCHNNKAFLFCLPKGCSRRPEPPLIRRLRPTTKIGSGSTPKVAAPAPQHCIFLLMTGDLIFYYPHPCLKGKCNFKVSLSKELMRVALGPKLKRYTYNSKTFPTFFIFDRFYFVPDPSGQPARDRLFLKQYKHSFSRQCTVSINCNRKGSIAEPCQFLSATGRDGRDYDVHHSQRCHQKMIRQNI